MKTIREWLETLPKTVAKKAIKNSEPHILDLTEKDLLEAVSGAFVWSETKEGHNYWFKIAKKNI